MFSILKSATARVMMLALAGMFATGCGDKDPVGAEEIPSGRFRAEVTGAVTASLEGQAVFLSRISSSPRIELRDDGTQGTIVFWPGGIGGVGVVRGGGSVPSFQFKVGEYPVGVLTNMVSFYSADRTSQARPYFALSGILRISEAADPRVVGTFTWEGSADPRDLATRIRVPGAGTCVFAGWRTAAAQLSGAFRQARAGETLCQKGKFHAGTSCEAPCIMRIIIVRVISNKEIARGTLWRGIGP
jgi:hypothetical protein